MLRRQHSRAERNAEDPGREGHLLEFCEKEARFCYDRSRASQSPIEFRWDKHRSCST